jgi:MoaA/NifB/PqqE/SkfB family radical SAM enzyme
MSYINIDNLNVINVELTDYCNAACPMCSRFKWDGTLNKDKTNKNHTTIELIKDKIPLNVIKRLKKFYSLGTYGDPLMNPDTAEIYKYIRENNSDCLLQLSTNGGGRDEKFWKSLAHAGVNVFFSIDGLEDTNHLYRRNVNWDKLMTNVKTFIEEGGIARWAFIIFKHNENQIDAAKELSKKMGFTSFGTIYSNRWKEYNWINGEIKDISSWPVDDYFIEKPISQENKYYGKKPVKVSNEKFNLSKKINCWASNNEQHEIYLRANGFVQPCCMLGDIDVHQSRFLIRNFDSVNLNKSSLEDILNGIYFKELQNGIEGGKTRLKNCFYSCGVDD